ncbi:MAG: L-seryl-tRNA(Sec) selenium transferase, partial [Nitrospirae bacterium]
KNPLTRAVRIDKLTLAAFEATLMEYVDLEKAVENIPTLRMLLQKPETIKERAKRMASGIKRHIKNAGVAVVPDTSKAGGGSLPEMEFPTYAVAIRPEGISVNELEERLRKGAPPIIARIKDDALLLDARTVRNEEMEELVKGVHAALYL